MSAMMEIAIFFLGQSVILLGAILTAYIKTKIDIAEMRVHLLHVKHKADSLSQDHKTLSEQVQGISRNLAALTGKNPLT